jgi:hypothetical protein
VEREISITDKINGKITVETSKWKLQLNSLNKRNENEEEKVK